MADTVEPPISLISVLSGNLNIIWPKHLAECIMATIPPYGDIKQIFDNEATALDYLIAEGVLQVPYCCELACRQEGK